MEKIELITKEKFIEVTNFLNEKNIDYICDGKFVFEKGKIYGIICEYGGGGQIISSLLSNQIFCDEQKIYIDGDELHNHNIQSIGWYVGSPIYSGKLIKKEISVRQALNYSINKYHRYNNVNEIIDEFHLTRDRLSYGLSKYSGEKWRASLAIGYVSNKVVYCFPWMNTMNFYDCLINSAVYYFFKKLKNEGAIIILPTSRIENVEGFADEIIEIDNPRFRRVVSEDLYFKEYWNF